MTAALERSVGRAFYRGSTTSVARRLLGAVLVQRSAEGRTAGRIVETEAYLAGDPAAHSFRGPTDRNRSMFLERGHAYVYRIYGLHHCFNVVTAPAGVGEAVLVRALEPLEGFELMARRRDGRSLGELCSGPARLVRAMGIGAEHDGVDLVGGALSIHAPPARARRAGRIVSATRVGISRAADEPLRFYIEGNPFVSRR